MGLHRRIAGLLLILIALLLAGLMFWTTRQFAIDSCLDRGGRWIDGKCECP